MSKKKEGGKDRYQEKALLIQQSLKYADDIARVYEEEKAKRKELEASNEKLRREVLERKRAEAALKESEERFRAVFETAQDCIYIKDESLKYTHVNPAMESLFQLPASEILGKDDEELYGIEVGAHLKRIDSRVLGGESIEEEHTRPVRETPITFLEPKSHCATGPARSSDSVELHETSLTACEPTPAPRS